uniref:Uncharacterized protein n=1 Tax=Biomphalaria glabrata TaxID=6526 RepID=A0A2C9JG52_BIOGL
MWVFFIILLSFYLIITFLGIWAARKFGIIRTSSQTTVDDVLLANRSIGLTLGLLSMTATWVGGSFILGTAEVLHSEGGLIWCQAPIGYALSLIVGGRFFASQMRNSGYRTMFDPFLWKYGDIMHCLLFVPALVGDITYCAGILNAIGSALKVVLDLKQEIAIVISAACSCIYTLLGGMYAVAYTDVLQLACLCLGLWLSVPFVLTNKHVSVIYENTDWVGRLETNEILVYMDTFALIVFGAIPWQVYWQRVLAAKSGIIAKQISYIGALGCLFMAIPAVLIGAAAFNAKWKETDYAMDTLLEKDNPNVMPLVLKYFTPPVVLFISMAAIAAGAMSSTDSSLLSSSGIFARNIVGLMYYRIFQEKLSQNAQISIMRAALVIITGLSCVISLLVDSTYSLWVLSSDLVYVILFPQFLCVLHVRKSNAYGSFVSFCTGLTLRLLGGERKVFFGALIKYPWYDETNQCQLFPFKTFSMILSLLSLIGVSYLTHFLFNGQYISMSYDFFKCFQTRESLQDEVIKNVFMKTVSATMAPADNFKEDKTDVADQSQAPQTKPNDHRSITLNFQAGSGRMSPTKEMSFTKSKSISSMYSSTV